MDVIYEAGKEPFTVGSPEVTSSLSGCKDGQGIINLQFGQKWKYEKVDYLSVINDDIMMDFLTAVFFRKTTSLKMWISLLVLVELLDFGWDAQF